MDLIELEKNWDEFGKTDPLWAILTNPGTEGGKWNLNEFFALGRQEIAGVFERAKPYGLPLRREAALDFGCGVGRLTQALCGWFERACGVDIAPSMIELARRYNQYGGRCEYFQNSRADLSIFADNSFDLIYSKIALQHAEPRYSAAYIREFARILRSGGLMVFQIPDRKKQPEIRGGCGPMPNGGFRARLTGYPAAIQAAGGAQIPVAVTVQNVSDCIWPSVGDRDRNYIVQLGNHWLTPAGERVIWDDARQPIPHDLPPNDQLQMVLKVTAPRAGGKYLLELDMVQELVAWFAQKSSPSAWIEADIEPAAEAAPVKAPPPVMEAYGIEKERVVEILTSSGAKVLDAIPDVSAGPEWYSFLYFATK